MEIIHLHGLSEKNKKNIILFFFIFFIIGLSYVVTNNILTDIGFIYESTYNRTIIINLDDSTTGQYKNAYPILNEYGFKATYAIITSYTEIKNSQIKKMYNNGMDIESHTKDHIDLSKIFNPFTIIYELKSSKDYLTQLGINSDILILPNGGGAYNIIYRLVIGNYYNYSRGQLFNASLDESYYNLNLGFNRYNIPSVALGNYTTFQDFKNLINETTLKNKTIIITYHKIEDKSDTYLTVTTDTFKKEMDYLYTLNVNVITLKQYLEG